MQQAASLQGAASSPQKEKKSATPAAQTPGPSPAAAPKAARKDALSEKSAGGGLGIGGIAVGLTAVLLTAAVFVWLKIRSAAARAKAQGSLGRRGAGTSHIKRTDLLLCGPCASGKTTLFLRLTQGLPGAVDDDTSLPETHMSMEANISDCRPLLSNAASPNMVGTANLQFSGKIVRVVDYPGHLRLREGLDAHLAAAKVIVFTIDAVTLQDERHGIQHAASTIATLFQNPCFLQQQGPAKIIIAATKRDSEVSFTAKAMKKLLEGELTRQLTTRAGAVGAVATKDDDASSRSRLRRGDMLELAEGEKFTFEAMCPVPFDFVDCSTISSPADPFSYVALLAAVTRGFE